MKKLVLILASLTLAHITNCMQTSKTDTQHEASKNKPKTRRLYSVDYMKSLKERSCKGQKLNITEKTLLALKDDSQIISSGNCAIKTIETSDLLEVFLMKKILIEFEENSQKPSSFKILYTTRDNKKFKLKFMNPYSKDSETKLKPEIIENIKLITSKMLLLKDLQQVNN